MLNDLQTQAEKLLSLKISIAPAEAEIERLKDVLAEATNKAGEGLSFASTLGMVSTRKGSVKTSKGKIPVLKPALWPLVAEPTRTQLQLLGVIVIEEQFSKESKAAVTIKPSTAALLEKAAA